MFAARGQKHEATFQSTVKPTPAKPTPQTAGWAQGPGSGPTLLYTTSHDCLTGAESEWEEISPLSLSLFSTPYVWYRNRSLHLRTFYLFIFLTFIFIYLAA